MSKNKLRDAIRHALYVSSVAGTALALGSIAAPASAQSADQATPPPQGQPQTLQTIVVTGSHIRRVDLETSNPVVTVDRQQIQATGKQTLGDIIEQLPAVMGPQTNPSTNNSGGGGESTVGLRGLGGNRTLVLLDGHRLGTTLNSTVDVNTIPANMVERVEVLTTGASAIYGSDAVAGVINIITRKNYQGAEFSADYGISDRDDGVRKGGSFTFGQTSDKGSIIAGIDYNKQEAIFEGHRRDFGPLAPATTLVGSTTTTSGKHIPITPFASPGGSSSGVFGNIALPPNLKNSAQFPCTNVARNAGSAGTSLADYHCFGQADKYDYAAVNYALTPQERTSAFFNGTYHLTDNIDAYMNVYHTKTSAAFDLAPVPLLTTQGLIVAADNPFNPFGTPFANGDVNGVPGNKFSFRAVPLGLRGSANGLNIDVVHAGLKGQFPIGQQNWSWDAGVDYTHHDFTAVIQGLVNSAVVNSAFGSPNGNGTCGPLAITCANPFNVNDPTTIAALQQAKFNPLRVGYGDEKVARLDLSGGLFDLPAGTMQLAVGGSYRKEYQRVNNDPVLQVNPATSYTCSAGSQCGANLRGGFSVKEAYAELFVPILKDLPFVKALNVTLGDRFSDYSDFGSTSNWKIGLEYRPIDDLLLRGTVAKVFRAPTVTDIFGSPNSSASKLSADPCDGFTGAAPGSGPALACANVPTDGTFRNTDVQQSVQSSVITTGSQFANFPIKPENGKSFDFGFVYSPHFIPGLSVSADAWRIYLNNTIVTLGLQSVLNLCYQGSLTYCPLIHRFPSGGSQGEIAPSTLLPTGNLGRTDTRGVDFSANYKLPQFSFGQFNIGLNATYLAQYDNASAPGLPGNVTVHDAGHFLPFGSAGQGACPGPNGGVCLFPRVRAQANLGWQLGPWDASLRTRYISKFNQGTADLSQQVFPAGPLQPGFVLHYGSTVYNDLSVGYNIEPINTKVDFGVDNVFDKAPPLLYANNTLNANTDPSDFDLVGRYYHARVTVKF